MLPSSFFFCPALGCTSRYDDFHVAKMPLLDEEVRGVEALNEFAEMLVDGYTPPDGTSAAD